MRKRRIIISRPPLNNMKNVLARWIENLREKSASRGYTCDACGVELFDYPTHRLCDGCQALHVKNDKSICPKCGRKLISNGVCLTCKSIPPAFTQALSPFVYEGALAGLINRLKSGNRRLAYYFAEQMAKHFLESPLAEDLRGKSLLVLAVPLTKQRQNKRGYNQAQALAKIITKKLNEAGMYATNDDEVLTKTRETGIQKHLSSKERAQNAKGAYHVHKRKLCAGKTILLIDDILTTGATGSECARILQSAGASAVYLLTIASMAERK